MNHKASQTRAVSLIMPGPNIKECHGNETLRVYFAARNINTFDKIEKHKWTEYPKMNRYSDTQTTFFDFKNLNNSKQGCPTV